MIYYSEGMAAPMGDFQNYQRVPRAVMVVDRSLREEALGVYSTTERPANALKDVGVLVFLPPGTWQQRQIAHPLDGGVYEITLNVPESGVYLLFVESPSKRVWYRQLPYLTLHANAAQ